MLKEREYKCFGDGVCVFIYIKFKYTNKFRVEQGEMGWGKQNDPSPMASLEREIPQKVG